MSTNSCQEHFVSSIVVPFFFLRVWTACRACQANVFCVKQTPYADFFILLTQTCATCETCVNDIMLQCELLVPFFLIDSSGSWYNEICVKRMKFFHSLDTDFPCAVYLIFPVYCFAFFFPTFYFHACAVEEFSPRACRREEKRRSFSFLLHWSSSCT